MSINNCYIRVNNLLTLSPISDTIIEKNDVYKPVIESVLSRSVESGDASSLYIYECIYIYG